MLSISIQKIHYKKTKTIVLFVKILDSLFVMYKVNPSDIRNEGVHFGMAVLRQSHAANQHPYIFSTYALHCV